MNWSKLRYLKDAIIREMGILHLASLKEPCVDFNLKVTYNEFRLVVDRLIKTYNKLVRDRIPEIIEASSKSCVTEILPDEAYLRMLDTKLDEELAEYHADQNIEELADLMEVIRACAVARGYTIEQLEQVRVEKAAKRGGFEKKILLKEVTEP